MIAPPFRLAEFDILFNKAPWTVPAVWLGLSNKDPILRTDTGSAVDELDYGGYARIQRQGTEHWTDPGSDQTFGGGGTPNTQGQLTKNEKILFWPQITSIGSFSSVNYVFAADASTGGNIIWFTNSGGGAENLIIGMYPGITNSDSGSRLILEWY